MVPNSFFNYVSAGKVKLTMRNWSSSRTSKVLLLLSRGSLRWHMIEFSSSSVRQCNLPVFHTGQWLCPLLKQRGRENIFRRHCITFPSLSLCLSALYSWGLFFMCFYYSVLWELLRHTLPGGGRIVQHFPFVFFSTFPCCCCLLQHSQNGEEKKKHPHLNMVRVKVVFHSQQP